MSSLCKDILLILSSQQCNLGTTQKSLLGVGGGGGLIPGFMLAKYKHSLGTLVKSGPPLSLKLDNFNILKVYALFKVVLYIFRHSSILNRLCFSPKLG